MECTLQQLDDGKWWCPTCDEDKERLLPRWAHRRCRKPRESALVMGKRRIAEKIGLGLAERDYDTCTELLLVCVKCNRWQNGCVRLGSACQRFEKTIVSICCQHTRCEFWESVLVPQ